MQSDVFFLLLDIFTIYFNGKIFFLQNEELLSSDSMSDI